MLQQTYFGNTLQTWLFALAAGVLAIAVLGFLSATLTKRLRKLGEKTSNDLDNVLAETLAATRRWFVFVVGIWAASLVPTLPVVLLERIQDLMIIALIVQAGIWGNTAINRWVDRYGERKLAAGEGASVTSMRALAFVVRLTLWTLLVLMALGSFGIEVTPLVAGLGIGSIAVALAVQNILGDLFASLSIILDKPFVVGDFITVGDMAGTVERVGIKTTRVRALSGEQLVFANSDLLTSRIRNFKQMYERRAVFSFGLVYQTSHETLQRVPRMVEEIVEAQEHARFDRAHFFKYGASSLDFEVVYYVKVPEYGVYMDIQQAINLEMFRRFEQDGIEFAYPTQTLIMTGGAPAEA